MDSKDSFPKTVLPLPVTWSQCLSLRNLPAVTSPAPPSRRAACGHCGDGLRDKFNFFKLNLMFLHHEVSKRGIEMTFASHTENSSQ